MQHVAFNDASGASAPPGFRWEIITLHRKSKMEPTAYRGGRHLALRYILTVKVSLNFSKMKKKNFCGIRHNVFFHKKLLTKRVCLFDYSLYNVLKQYIFNNYQYFQYIPSKLNQEYIVPSLISFCISKSFLETSNVTNLR